MSGSSRRDSSEEPRVCGERTGRECQGAAAGVALGTHSDCPKRNVAVQVLKIEWARAPPRGWVELDGGEPVREGGVAAGEEEVDKMGGAGDGEELRDGAETGVEARGGRWAGAGAGANNVQGSRENDAVEEQEEALASRGRN